MPLNTPARHRRPGRLTAAAHLTRTAAIAATSTGLMVGTAVTTASATPVAHEPTALSQDGALVGDQLVSAPSDPVLTLIEAGLLSERALVVDAPAKAVAAPADVDADSFGVSGFTAASPVVAPVAEAAAVNVEEPAALTTDATSQDQAAAALDSRTQTSANRSEQRAQAPVTPAQPAAPAPQPAPPAAPPSNGGAAGIASGLMGIPYAYAGSTPAGFDCSGFTRYVYAQLGVSLPHSSSAQQAMATPVSNPQPGDLVFFGSPAWHVGIYAGNGMIYHATNPGSVSNMMSISSIHGSVSGYGRVG